MRSIALVALALFAGCKQEDAPRKQPPVRTEPSQKPDRPAPPDEEVPDIEIVEVAPGISMLVGMGGNIGVVTGPGGALIIDDQMPPIAAKLKAAIAKLGGPVRVVVNTHWHGDHSGNNEMLAGEGAIIVAHQNVRTRMSSEQFVKAMDKKVPPSPEGALPVVTFAEDVTLHWGGQELHAFHVAPAHTDSDSVMHFVKANVIHTGDVYFNGGYPFFDASTGGNVDGIIAAVDQILKLANDTTKIIPGHGPLSDRAGLVKYREMVVTARERVRALVRQKKTVDQIIAAKPTAQWDDALGTAFVDPGMFVKLLVEDAQAR
jgi:glyoxylase-like metal-dependent hydrolase (beta-lactamase superfamily II)